MDQLTDVAEGLNPLLPCQSLLSLSRVHYKKNMSGDASPAQDEKTLPCFISSNRLRHCGSFPSENTPGHAEQEASRSRHLSRQKSPMLRMLRGDSRYFSEISRQPALPLPAAAIIFLFSRFPCCGVPSICLRKLPPVRRPAVAIIFFAALFRRLSHAKKLKQKGKETRSGSSFPQSAFCKRSSSNDERLLNRSLSKDNLGIGLLSHVKVRSIMGDEALNFRVRNGIGCTRFSMDTKEIFQNI